MAAQPPSLNLPRRDVARESLDEGCAKLAAGDVFGAHAAFERAEAALQLENRLESAMGASVLVGLGSAKLAQGDVEGAAAAYSSVSRISSALGDPNTADALSALTALGRIWLVQQKPQEAAQCWQQARDVREAMGCLHTPEGASLVSDLGMARRLAGDEDGAAAAYQEALGLHKDERVLQKLSSTTSLPGRPSLSGSTIAIGSDAPPLVNPADLLTTAVGTATSSHSRSQRPDSRSGPSRFNSNLNSNLNSNSNFGPGSGDDRFGSLSKAQLEDAALTFEQERSMMEATLTLDTAAGAELMMNLGIVKRLLGDLEGAAECYREARRIDVATNVEVLRPGTATTGDVAPSDFGFSTSRPGTALRPGSSVGLVGTEDEGSSFTDPASQGQLPRTLAAGSPLQAARQAKRLEAKLDLLRNQPPELLV